MRCILSVLLILFTISCSSPHYPAPVSNIDSPATPDIIEEDDADVSEDEYSIWTDPCVECAFYFCPPLDAVWQKRMCFDYCVDPPILVLEEECIEYLECNPTQYLI